MGQGTRPGLGLGLADAIIGEGPPVTVLYPADRGSGAISLFFHSHRVCGRVSSFVLEPTGSESVSSMSDDYFYFYPEQGPGPSGEQSTFHSSSSVTDVTTAPLIRQHLCCAD